MLSDFKDENIDDYLNNKLKGQALRDFDLRIKVDKEFKEEINFLGILVSAIIESGKENLRKKIKLYIENNC